jgi:hypothetical protein
LGYIFRQRIIEFRERDFKGRKTRKRTSIHTYLETLERKRFVKKIDCGKNAYYMLTKKGETFANNSPVLYEKRLPNNQKFREAVVWAQYYLCNNMPLHFLYANIDTIEDIYTKLMDIIDSPIYVINGYSLVDEFINLVNMSRREAKLPLAEIKLIDKEYKVVNADFEYDTSGRLSKYYTLLAKKIEFNKFISFVQKEKTKLEKAIVRCNMNSYESSIKNHNYWNAEVGYSRCVELLSFDTSKTDLLYERFFGRNFIQYNFQLLKRYYDSADEKRKVIKKDVMYDLFRSSIYVQGLIQNQLKIIIIDINRDKNWYSEKLLDIDIMLRRMNYLSNNIITASIAVIIDDEAKEKHLKKITEELFEKYKRYITREHYKLGNMDNFLWDRTSIYFINPEVSITLSEAKKYYIAAARDKKIEISRREIKL